MANIFFQVSSLAHIIVTAVIYLSKTKQKTIENHVYRSLILFAFGTLILDTISILCGTYLQNKMVNEIVGKLYLSGLVSWMIIYTYYLFVITHQKSKVRLLMSENEDSKLYLDGMKKAMLLNLIIIILMMVLPLFSQYTSGRYSMSGPAEIFSYIIGAVCIFAWLVIFFRAFKDTKKQNKRLILISILIAIGTLTIQLILQDLVLTSSIGAFVTILAYFMLENPDLHYIEELNIATRQAESANHAKSDFLSSMSHEIRTPLNAIVGFSQALAKEDISGSAKDEVKEILNASTTLLETVNGILDISKIEANKIELLNVDYSTKKLINEVISQANSRIGSKPIEFKVDIDQDIPQVLRGDVVRIKQIILNLLTNAIKYTKSGYVKFRIDTQTSQNKCLLTIIVEDTGIGLTKEEIDLLFVKFQRFEMDKNINILGTGLGMAITKGLLDLMNGEIAIESEHGKGSTFTIILEQEVSSKSIDEIVGEEELQKIEPFNATGQRVLVVDDNKINLKVAEKMLSEYQVTIDMVDTGRECINKIIAGEKYDLILLDIMMPKMKGPEVLKNLKEQPGFNTPVIALTADVVSGMDEKYTAQGFNDCLPKPIVEEELFYLLKRYLKEVTDEGLLEDNYSPIETPVEVVSPIVKEVIEPTPVVEEEPVVESIELPAPANEEIELPSLIEDLPKMSELKKQSEEVQIIEEPKEVIEEIKEETITPEVKITNDRFELIEMLSANKENPTEYAKLSTQIKEIAEKIGLKELAAMAYEHELAGKASYQEFITDNYDTFINEIINNLNVIKANINKE